MRPVRIIATAAFIAALTVTGCASRSADQTAAASSLKRFVSSHDQPDRCLNHPANRRVDRATTATTVTPANPRCALSPA